MVRLGILGAGTHSSYHHGPALRQLRQDNPHRVELAAVCDLDESKARAYAKQFGFQSAYANLDKMLGREKLDGLVLVTPLAATFEIVAKALPLGLPLMIEKPPGRTPAETADLLSLARKHACPNIVSFNRRFDPAVELARRWVAENAQGRPVLQAIARMLRVERREAGFVADTGIHLADTVLSFMPGPTRVESRLWKPQISQARGGLVSPGGESCDGRIEFQDGRSAVMIFAPDCGVKEETYELIGSEYCIQIDTVRHGVKVFDRGRLTLEWIAPADLPPHVGDGALGEAQRFLAAIEGEQPYWPTLEDGLVSMRVAHALQAGGVSRIAGVEVLREA
ncbi:MAG: Gfo/Idh/MocA family protein [Phycisphaerae bacterium]